MEVMSYVLSDTLVVFVFSLAFALVNVFQAMVQVKGILLFRKFLYPIYKWLYIAVSFIFLL